MRVRRTVVLLVLLVSAALPVSAFAAVPGNDTVGGATVLQTAYTPSSFPVTIPPVGPAPTGGWTDATSTEDGAYPLPSCLGRPVYHSMWYSITLAEASVLTLTLQSTSVARFQPVLTVNSSDPASLSEQACGLGGSDSATDPAASVSTFLIKGTYLVRVASVDNTIGFGPASEGPTLTLLESLQDVTPPQIAVSVSGTTRIVGPGQAYHFDATGSVDKGSGVNPSSAIWEFFENGRATEVKSTDGGDDRIVDHVWKTAGQHEVTLKLSDRAGNSNLYVFSVLVHNFVPPKVGLTVSVPAPGARTLHLVLRHDVPIRVRLVVLQGGRVLVAIHSKLIRGSLARTSFTIALRKRVGKVGFVAISGVASDLGQYPNTVPLLTCSVDPVNRGGTCG